MTPRFTRRFQVRHYELDVSGQVSSVFLVRYMQEAAIEASTSLGFSPDWYRQHRVGWVVRKLSVRYHAPATYGDTVEVSTWLSGLRGVRSIREYDLTRSRDGTRVARGRAEWVYMDGQTGQPTRVPDEWAEAFPATGDVEDLGVRLGDPTPIENAHRHTSRRRVQFHELDTVQHVNHAVYLQWAEQANHDAIRIENREQGTGNRKQEIRTCSLFPVPCSLFQGGHEIQYFAAALDNENIEIVSWLCERAAVGAAWTHEIYNADTRKLLARDYSRLSFANGGRDR